MIDVAWQTYPDRGTMMRDLAALVGDQLRAAHASNNRATLAVPGGSTPEPFLRALSEADLAWADIAVLPTDERLVPETSPRSNSRLIRDALLHGPAAGARLLPMFGIAGRAAPALDALGAQIAEVLPLDVLVLGMGADMHTASLFPGAPELPAALADDAPPVMVIHPPDAPEPRITLTAPVLRGAGVIHILITGAEKAAAARTALAGGPVPEAPVRVALTAACPVTVHHAD